MDEPKEFSDHSTTRSFLVVRGTEITGKKKPTSYLETIIHCIKAYVGTGIFAMGALFNNSGILLGPLLLLVIALINLHCQHILIKACVKITEKETVDVLPSFAETVQYTLEDSNSLWLQKRSKTIGIVTDVFIVVAQYGICIVYFIFVSRHLGEIAAANGWEQNYRVILAIILIPMWLSTFLGNLKLLVPVSLTSNIIMWAAIVLIVYYAGKDLPPISERGLVSHVDKLPIFFGIVLFAFEAITFIIPLRMEMKNPDSFTSTWGILNVSLVVVLILYFFVGFFAFWQWGKEVERSVFLNMPEKESLSQTTKILVSIGVLLTYALHMYIAFEIAYPRIYRRWGPFDHTTTMIYAYRSIAVIVTYAFANISSNLELFISLVGAVTGAMLTMFLPAFLELVMLYGKLTYYIIIKDSIIIIIAIAAAITGTILSIISIIKEYSEEK